MGPVVHPPKTGGFQWLRLIASGQPQPSSDLAHGCSTVTGARARSCDKSKAIRGVCNVGFTVLT